MNFSGKVWLHRRIQENPIWTQLSPAVLKVWLFCLMQANWKPKETWYTGDAEIDLPIGSFVTSYRKMADETHLSMRQVRSALEHLASLSCTRTRTIQAPGRAHQTTMVTVCNYRDYQIVDEPSGHAKGHTSDTPSDTRATHERHANGKNGNFPQPNVLETIKTEVLVRTPLKEEDFKTLRQEDKTAAFGDDLWSLTQRVWIGELPDDGWQLIGTFVRDADDADQYQANTPLWMQTRKYQEGYGVSFPKYVKQGIWKRRPNPELLGEVPIKAKPSRLEQYIQEQQKQQRKEAGRRGNPQ